MNSYNYISRKGKFDAGHRIMFERVQCANIHGHEFRYQMKFTYRSALEIGYPIDFKELKRIACQWINDTFDHAFIANPHDRVMIDTCNKLQSKLYIMNLHDKNGFCNPSAENIAKEIFYAVSILMNDDNLKLVEITLHETSECYVLCQGLTPEEYAQFNQSSLLNTLIEYKKQKGVIEYDERKLEFVSNLCHLK